jgi:cytochrome oxidase Cu insertion factor (SCO1/SenC/PrrC family)
MAHSSPPASRKHPRVTGAGTSALKRKPTASRSARRRPSRRRLLPRIIALAVTLALLVGIIALVRAASLSTPASSNTATTTGASTGGTSSAPDFTRPLLSGTTFQLAAKLGHPVVLYFMSPTCAQGSRNLAQASQSIKTQGAEVLAIDVNPGDRLADLQAFVRSDGITASAPMQWGVDPNGAIPAPTTYRPWKPRW